MQKFTKDLCCLEGNTKLQIMQDFTARRAEVELVQTLFLESS